MTAYYNEFDPYAAQWLRNLIAAGHIAPGEVDERSIADVQPDDLHGFTQCHFFAGIGGWSLAARLAGWPDDRELWTGSCPCQPFSVAGKQAGQADERHLWPEQFRLISARRPDVWMGEQVAAAVGKHWLDGVHSDLESIGYASGAAVVPACAVDAPHRRDRAWIVADAAHQRIDGGRDAGQGGWPEHSNGSCASDVADTNSQRPFAGSDDQATRYRAPIAADRSQGTMANPNSQRSGQEHQNSRGREDGSGARQVTGPDSARHGAMADADQFGQSQEREQRSGQFCGAGGDQKNRALANANGIGSSPRIPAAHGRYEGQSEVADHRSNRRAGAWGECDWLQGADGKARRFEPGIRLLAHGVPARVGKLRAYGNAIVPQVAAEIIAAYMEVRP